MRWSRQKHKLLPFYVTLTVTYALLEAEVVVCVLPLIYIQEYSEPWHKNSKVSIKHQKFGYQAAAPVDNKLTQQMAVAAQEV